MTDKTKDSYTINGVSPVNPNSLPPYWGLWAEEVEAASWGLDLEVLSSFIRATEPGFHGGLEVQATEREAADIGGFSLNHHKHIHCREGGLLVTDDGQLAERLRLIRNHGETGIQSDDPNILDHNFRLGEVEVAIDRAHPHKLLTLLASRQRDADRLQTGLKDLPGSSSRLRRTSPPCLLRVWHDPRSRAS